MSFIDDSTKNTKKYSSSFKELKKLIPLLKEVTAAGAAGGFVGRAGMGVDDLFAGAYHPDSGHGSENEKLLKKQLKDRKKLRKDIESSRDGVIDDYSGLADPVGGYYETDTEFASLAYEELELRNQLAIEFSIENTPLSDTEWKSTGWDYDYDEIISYIEEKDFINTSETNMEKVGIDIQYDDNSSLYAGENYINQSQTNWKIIDRG